MIPTSRQYDDHSSVSAFGWLWAPLFLVMVPLVIGQGCGVPFGPSGVCPEWGAACGGQPVVAYAGRDIELAACELTQKRLVLLDASLSIVRGEGDPQCTWSEGGQVLGTGVKAEVDFPVGTHDVLLEVTDAEGNFDSDTLTVTITEPVPFLRGSQETEPQCGAMPPAALVLSGLLLLALRLHVHPCRRWQR
jgi:hypothetical protein